MTETESNPAWLVGRTRICNPTALCLLRRVFLCGCCHNDKQDIDATTHNGPYTITHKYKMAPAGGTTKESSSLGSSASASPSASASAPQPPKRRADTALIVTILSLAFVSLLYGAHTTVRLHQEHDDADDQFLAIPPLLKVTAERLKGEKLFWKSIKSCLPKYREKCQEFIPDGVTKPRVAVLSPPGMFGEWAFNWIQRKVMESIEDDPDVNSIEDVMDLHHVTHIVPYGYGKSHGWTRLIRVMPDNLMLGAADAVLGSRHKTASSSSLSSSSKHSSSRSLSSQTVARPSLEDVKTAMRQLMRWHCRISHVAAHTALLTLDMPTISRNPKMATKTTLTFLRLNTTRHEQDYGGEDTSDDHPTISYKRHPQDAANLKEATRLGMEAATFLSTVQHHAGKMLRKELETVLVEELILSNNQTAWPCPSLWDIKPKLGSVGKSLAKALAPNCTAEHTNCFVQRDKCEAKGDPVCTKGKKDKKDMEDKKDKTKVQTK